MIVDPFPCPRQCIEQSCVLQALELTPRQHPLPDQFRVVVGAAELIFGSTQSATTAGGPGLPGGPPVGPLAECWSVPSPTIPEM